MEFSISEEEMKTYHDLNTLFDTIYKLDEGRQINFIEEVLVSLEKSGPPTDGKRRRPRIKCNMIVNYEAEGVSCKGRLCDISDDGMFIKTEGTLTLGQDIRLTIDRPGEQRTLIFDCRVARASSRGIGVKFENINFHSNLLIKSVVWKLQDVQV